MIIIVDALNRHEYAGILDEMYKLRARVFADRLGWDVSVLDGREVDKYDAMDPAYVIGVDDGGHVVSCVRALQTTGPHMLADVFSSILDGEPPLRSATLWESTRFCVDRQRLARGRGPNTVSHATCELMIGSLEYAMQSGIKDIVTVIDPIMDRVLKRSDNAPYGYVGKTTPMGKVPAMAALLDCTEERINRVRAFADIRNDVFATATDMARLKDAMVRGEDAHEKNLGAFRLVDQPAEPDRLSADQVADYLLEQFKNSQSESENEAIRTLMLHLSECDQFRGLQRQFVRIVH